MLCKLEYSHGGIRPWTNDELVRLASLCHCTPRELCALVGLFNQSKMERHWEGNHWPLEISIQWAKLRRFRMGCRTPDLQDKLTAKMIAAGGTQEMYG